MSAHETVVLRREIAALESENQHLKEMLGEMADALYAEEHHVSHQVELERLVVVWIRRANHSAAKAHAAERELDQA